MTVIAIDVGATGIQAGFGGWPDRPDPVADDETPADTDALVGYVRTTVEDLTATANAADRPVSAVAIGLPGTLDGDGRLAESLHTGFAGADVSSAVGAVVDHPVVLANDTNAQALGCGADAETLCYVALGTGVGGALVADGDLVEGANGFAGEIGHVRVAASDRPCVCGKTGCLYTLAAGTALEADLGEAWWADELDATERDRVETAGAAVGEAAATAAALVDPDRIVVAGHLTARDAFDRGLSATWDHPFSDCALETVVDTWPLARDGLVQCARRERDGR